MTELDSEIIKLRKEGTAYKDISHKLKDKFGHVTRYYVQSLLIKEGLLRIGTWGGYRPSSGKGTAYIKDEIIFDSYAELIYYLFNQLNGIKVVKNIYEYFLTTNGKRYYPNFIDPDGNYIEIKSLNTNDYWGWNIIKVQDCKMSIKVITKDELLKMESFVLTKYSSEELNSYKK